MKLSKRSEYALRGLVQIALHESNGLVRLKDLAKNENIPLKFLEGILRELARVGILRSKRGLGGGYLLNKAAHHITLGQVIRLLDGPLAPLRCASETAYAPCSCPNEATCGIRSVMQEVRDSVANILDQTTLADVCAQTRRLAAGTTARRPRASSGAVPESIRERPTSPLIRSEFQAKPVGMTPDHSPVPQEPETTVTSAGTSAVGVE